MKTVLWWVLRWFITYATLSSFLNYYLHPNFPSAFFMLYFLVISAFMWHSYFTKEKKVDDKET